MLPAPPLPDTRPTISIVQVEHILQGARRQGLDVARILAQAGLSPALLAAPLSRVSQAQYASLIRVLRRTTRDEFWGLCNRAVPVGTFGECCRLLVHCGNLGAALRTGFRYYHRVLPDFVARLVVERGLAHLRLHTRGEADGRLDYAERVFMFFSFGLGSWLVARRIPVAQVNYAGPPPPQANDTARVFGAPVRYEQPYTGFSIEARWLELPVVQNTQSLAEFLRLAPANLIVRYRDRTSLTERTRQLLRGELHGELPTLEEVGRRLAVPPQTLRRRLREEGQGFQALKDDLRRDAAIEYLARPDLTLMDIAAQLGFSEASTFHRAFKKWTGVAPGEYRQSHGPRGTG
ncbi:AraC family transcriptional regulator [Piscinibacter sakaiensis]|nr:AraC family transcriptional regulator [Piscinibacter sakaiensis]